MLIEKQKRKRVNMVCWKENITENLEESPEAKGNTGGPQQRLLHKSLSPWASKFAGSITALGPCAWYRSKVNAWLLPPVLDFMLKANPIFCFESLERTFL